MDRAKAILKVAERLYAASLTADGWPEALSEVVELLGANHAVMIANGSENPGALLVAGARVDEPDLVRSISAHQLYDAGPVAWHALPVATAVTHSALVSDRDLERSAYYNEVVRPLNGFRSAVLRQEQATASFMLAICRPRHARDFEAPQIGTLQALTPHLTNALAFHARLRHDEARLAGFTSLLDQLSAGVVLTDALAQPVFFNRRAAEIVTEADGLRLEGDGVSAASPPATERLRDAIVDTAAAQDRSNGNGYSGNLRCGRHMHLPRPSGRLPLLLTLLPMSRLGIAIPGIRAPEVAIFIAEPDDTSGIAREALADTFRLTPRECDIAVLLAGGADPASIAMTLGLGVGTVRFHLKHVFDKTGVHSQAALVAVLRSFAGQ